MERTIELQEHYGANVWTHKEMDGLRRTECMCRLCGKLVIGNEDENCTVAQACFAVCQAGDIAMSITRCPRFQPKELANPDN
jgi:hypothetical protein